jgi:hypothetical protein
MDGSPSTLESSPDPGVGADRESAPGTPRWVKISAIVVLIVVLVFVVLLITGGPGRHGPGRHTGSGDGGGDTRRAHTAEVHRPPPGIPGH